jgi:hypothetical protein
MIQTYRIEFGYSIIEDDQRYYIDACTKDEAFWIAKKLAREYLQEMWQTPETRLGTTYLRQFEVDVYEDFSYRYHNETGD